LAAIYANITIVGSELLRAASYLKLIGRSCYLAQARERVYIIFDEAAEVDPEGELRRLAAELARVLDCWALAVANHEDEVLWYGLFHGDEAVDEYRSGPLGAGDGGAAPMPGNGETLSRALGVAASARDVARILATPGEPVDGYLFASQRHRDLAAALAIRPDLATVGYQGIRDGALADAPERDLFLRFRRPGEPPPAAPVDEAAPQEPAQPGLLVRVGGEPRGEGRAYVPVCCPVAGSSAFLIAWAWSQGHPGSASLDRYEPPWTRQPASCGLWLTNSVSCLAVSPSGGFLAAGHASGNWLTEVWDLRTIKKLDEVSHTASVSRLAFSPDERWLYSLTDELVATSLRGDGARSVPMPLHSHTLALHPEGVRGVVGAPAELVVVDLARAVEVARLAFGERLRAVSDLAFSAAGEHLFAATEGGALAYDWQRLQAADGVLPEPAARAGTSAVLSLADDSRRNALLFGSDDGSLRWLDLDGGGGGLLLEGPDQTSLSGLVLSADGTILATVFEGVAGRQPPVLPTVALWDLAALWHEAGQRD
jgi:hypothetical protein